MREFRKRPREATVVYSRHHKNIEVFDSQGQGTAQEDSDHTGAQLSQLAEVAAQQHDKNHGVQYVVLKAIVCGLGLSHVVQADSAEDHVQDVDPNQGRNDIENLPLGSAVPDSPIPAPFRLVDVLDRRRLQLVQVYFAGP